MSGKETEKITVLYAKAGEKAQIIEIKESLFAMQALVGGPIDEYMPFDSKVDERIRNVALICNEEGKLRGLPLNRTIYGEDHARLDIICGDFFLCHAPKAPRVLHTGGTL